MKRLKKLSSVLSTVLLALFLTFSQAVEAQCPMCKANVESSLSSHSARKVGLGLDDGITILFVMPYLMVMLLGYLWYRNSKYQKMRRLVFED